jgi:hypothetical protein
MINEKENRPLILIQRQKSGATHTKVTPFKMAWLILGAKRCGKNSWIDVASGVYVEVSRVICTVVAPL